MLVETSKYCVFFLRVIPQVSWKILWFVTFLLTEEAKDLRPGAMNGVSSATAVCSWKTQRFSALALQHMFENLSYKLFYGDCIEVPR